MPPTAHLLRAYRATRYQVVAADDGAPVLAEARVDERSPALDRLLDEHGARSGVFITAWNPRSQPTPRARNEAAQRRLERELRRRDVRFLAHRGTGADPGWEPEQGLLALDLPLRANTQDHIAGNHVVLQTGEAEFVYLCHMQTGSVRVKPGDQLSGGDLIGLTGNSGNSSEPHLHIHAQTEPDILSPTAIGLPLRFSNYLANGKPVELGIPVQAQLVQRT